MRVSAGGPPSGVVTFLFTDIEGSTRRWETNADAMRAALLAHDEVLSTAIESYDGFLFSHTGDGVVAAFASPKAALDAAVTAQRRLELPVRMGIAKGKPNCATGITSERCSTGPHGSWPPGTAVRSWWLIRRRACSADTADYRYRRESGCRAASLAFLPLTRETSL